MDVSKDGYEKFSRLHAVFLASSIVTYLADVTLDVILAFTYTFDGYYAYAFITVCLVLGPTIIVQIFSARWHVMDELLDKATLVIHAVLLGLLHRYLVVISLGMEAMKTDDAVDYQRFYQQQSDVCMLRLFDSFLESAPQLVFHLYVMMHRKEEWSPQQAAWTALSAIISMVSLGWGIAAYSSAMRMVRTEKRNMTWMGMILQTLWRFGMLSARIVALVLLTLTVHEWIFIVMFVHWLVMTAWVVWQDTDFCANQWEERLYNAVVGVVYCFCFFNLKEGHSRYRASLFYAVVIVENFAFVTVFTCYSDFQDPLSRQNVAIAAFTFVTAGTSLGLMSMLLYYRFFHPVGPINPCSSICYGSEAMQNDDKVSKKDLSSNGGPDFEIDDKTASPLSRRSEDGGGRSPPSRPQRRASRRVEYSRSFKDSCPGNNRQTPRRRLRRRKDSRGSDADAQDNDDSTRISPSASNVSPRSVCRNNQVHADRLDSAYGTDSNRTHSRSTENGGADAAGGNRSGSSSLVNRSAGSAGSQAFNNETYMSIEGASPEAGVEGGGDQGQQHPDNTYNSVQSGGGGGVATTTTNDATSDFSQCSADSRVTVINRRDLYATPTKRIDRKPLQQQQHHEVDQNPEKPLKRSPVVKDVTEPTKEERKPEGLTAPLTIIIPNISHQAFARSNSGRVEKAINVSSVGGAVANLQQQQQEVHQKQQQPPLISVHDYENLALVNINRVRPGGGISHWHTYSDMASQRHDDSTAYDKSSKKNSGDSGGGGNSNNNKSKNSDYSNYSSLQYYDIYPLSREMRDRLYRSLTPVSTTATVASDSNTIVSDSDTYEPIEAYSVNEQSASSSSLPVTLIHHDGHKMTTRQVVSLENLKSVLQQHETIPMDDPQERGDLYLLAPMRLLTPILEESEHEMTRHTDATDYDRVGGQHKQKQQQQQQQQQQLNRSILTVISEILNASYPMGGTPGAKGSNNGTFPSVANDSIGQFELSNDGNSTVLAAAAAAGATSSLVHTIDELRNNSLCNLFFSSFADGSNSSGSNGDNKNSESNNNNNNTKGDEKDHSGAHAAPQVPPRNNRPGNSSSSSTKVTMQSAEEVVSVSDAPSPPPPHKPHPVSSTGQFSRDAALNASVKSIHSNTLVPSPSSVKKLSLVMPKPRSLHLHSRKEEEEVVEEIKPALPARRNSTPLLSTSAGSRKNIAELSAGNTADILNTPRRPPAKIPPPLTIVANPPPFQDIRACNISLSHPSTPVSGAIPVVPSSSLLPSAPLSRSHHELSMSLSPSSKYETPTPPLRPNQFVRSCNAIRMPRRKFSVLRQRFEEPSPAKRQPFSPASADLYQNISDGDLLNNDLSEISNKSASAPFLDSRKFELRADEKYEKEEENGGGGGLQQRRGWATSSTRQKVCGEGEAGRGVMAVRGRRASMSALDRMALEEEDEDRENRPPHPLPAPPAPPVPGPKPSAPRSRLPLPVRNFSPGFFRSPAPSPPPLPPSSSSAAVPFVSPSPLSWSPHLAGATHRRLTGSLSPRARIFDVKRHK